MTNSKFTFTRGKLRDLPWPRAGWNYFYDDMQRGLALGVSATGTKSFLVYRKFQGLPVRVTLGQFDAAMPDTHDLQDRAEPLDLLGNKAALNVRKARKLATAVNASLDRGVNPAVEKRRRRQELRQELTLGGLFEKYRDHLVSEGKKGVPGVVWYFQRYLGSLPEGSRKKHGRKSTKAEGSVNWQRRPLSALQRTDASRLRLALAKHISPTTANRVMELLKAIYNFGLEEDPPLFSGTNPAAKLPMFKLQPRKRRIRPHEARKFFEVLDSEPDGDFKDYVYLSICTGARRGNLLQMRWDEVSLDGASWLVAGEKMKNGDPLDIGLIPKAVEILRRRAENANGCPWVFPGNTPKGHAGPFRVKWARFIEKAEVPDLRIHDLRRTLGSWMSDTGSSTVTTMRALGHKTIDAALVYQDLELGPVRDAMAVGFRGLLKAAEPEPEQANVIEMPRKARRGKAKAGR
jgi:integrase